MTRRHLAPMLYFLLLAGCTTPKLQKPFTQLIDMQTIETLSLGDTSDKVLAVLGKPTETRSSLWQGKKVDFWIYDDEHSNQVASLLFDKGDQKLLNKLYIPQEHVPEKNLETLLKRNGLNGPSETVKIPACDRDYLPRESLLFYPELGLIIAFERTSKTVESISWTDSARAKSMIQAIKSCQNRK